MKTRITFAALGIALIFFILKYLVPAVISMVFHVCAPTPLPEITYPEETQETPKETEEYHCECLGHVR